MRGGAVVLGCLLGGALGCDRTVTDAHWDFAWETPTGVARDVWYDRGKTCAQSAAQHENMAALRHRSHQEVCARGRRDGGATGTLGWLQCEAAVTLGAERCEELQRRVPARPWMRLH